MVPISSIPWEIFGYRILPLSLLPLPSYPVHATHYLYLRPHEPKLPTPTAARSLFLVNVPFDATEHHIKNLLSIQIGLSQGRIEEIQFAGSKKPVDKSAENGAEEPGKGKKGKKRKRAHRTGDIEELEGAPLPSTWDRELRKDGLTAVVVFVDRPSMDAAYKAVKRIRKDGVAPVWGEGSEEKAPLLGSMRYITHHKLQYPDRGQLLQSVNTYMNGFAAREAAQARLQARKRQVPDEDGFVTVTRGARNGPAHPETAQELAVKQKDKQKGLEDFYRFQHRERKKAEAAQLIRKFEADKEKVRKMKERRGTFKPE